MSAFLAWYDAWSPTITGVLGGGLAVLAATLLYMIATALGPDLPVLQCVSPRARALFHLAAFSCFTRGVVVLTGIRSGDRHPHWETPIACFFTGGLCLYALGSMWQQRMPPQVRARFERRETFKRGIVQSLVAECRTQDAERATEGTSLGTQQMYELGLSPAHTRRLHDAPLAAERLRPPSAHHLHPGVPDNRRSPPGGPLRLAP